METVLMLECRGCGYKLVQDTKRDEDGINLSLLKECHENTFQDHLCLIREAKLEDESEAKLMIDRYEQIQSRDNYLGKTRSADEQVNMSELCKFCNGDKL